MRHRFAVFFIIHCPDERRRDELLTALRGTRGVQAHAGPPSLPGSLFATSVVLASSGQSACDRLQQRLHTAAPRPFAGTIARRSAARMRYQGGLAWSSSVRAEDGYDDLGTEDGGGGGLAGVREPRRPKPPHDSDHADRGESDRD